jgi:hypothetical protein
MHSSFANPLHAAFDRALNAAGRVLESGRRRTSSSLRNGSTAYPTPLSRFTRPPALLFTRSTFA